MVMQFHCFDVFALLSRCCSLPLLFSLSLSLTKLVLKALSFIKQDSRSVATQTHIAVSANKMLGGKNVLRRVRQRRALSKNFRRIASLTVNENEAVRPLQIPIYGSFLLGLVFTYYSGIKISLLFLSIYSVLKRYGVFSKIQSTFKAYRTRRQDHGPTTREKCYYFVDYWLSTNP